ncbi:MAG TPA: triose-phosphate isomerase [Casimicrobiaceae bacterium]|nr:triose-phosphate isomerase [Casimicrobiaceae bacterium]
MRGKLVVGNWKMNGGLAANATLLVALVAGFKPKPGLQMAVCVPFPYLAQARDVLAGSPVAWGAQDMSEFAAGAHTGDVAGGMIAEFGCRYAIVGHSERREQHGETDVIVAAKAKAALAAGLTPVVCVGETLAERDAGQWHTVVARQLDAVTGALGRDASLIVLAYEPCWAIGTGRTATPEQAQEVHAFLRGRLASAGATGVQVLYGGSVKAANAGALFAQQDVDGGLVGGASLDAVEFLAIANAC